MKETKATPRPWVVCNDNQVCGATDYIAGLAYSDLPEDTIKANAEMICQRRECSRCASSGTVQVRFALAWL